MNPEDEVREVERRRIGAFIAGDNAALDELHAPDYSLINPGGQELDRDAYLSGIASGFISYRSWQPEGEIVVRVYGDAAVLRYQTQIEIAVQGEIQPAQRFWHIDVYEKRDGRWQAVWSQATRISV